MNQQSISFTATTLFVTAAAVTITYRFFRYFQSMQLCRSPVIVGTGGNLGDSTPLGGHVDGVFLRGNHVWKRLQNRGRGDRELRFLRMASSDSRWSEFVPKFEGVETEVDGSKWLVMDSLVGGFESELSMDIKIGTRTWGAQTSPRKAMRQKLKSYTTTSGDLGVRIISAKIRNPNGQLDNVGQKVGKPARSREEVKRDIYRFLKTPKLRQEAIVWLEKLKDLFSTQKEWCFYVRFYHIEIFFFRTKFRT